MSPADHQLQPPDWNDRNLLFGILALQVDMIDKSQFVDACVLWGARKDTPLQDILVERKWLTPDKKKLVDQLLQERVKKNDGDVNASMADAIRNDDDPKQLLDVLSQLSVDESRQTAERYELIDGPKEGGIGRVWKARDKHLGREVALKNLKTEMALSKEVQARFFHEAQITAQLTHPNIVPAYELVRGGILESFYTMKWVDGPTMLEAVRAYHAQGAAGGRQFDLRELLNAFVAVCNAVAYAHDRGVIHRDLKGQNVILGDHGEVHVLDWGMAKALGRVEESSPMKPVELDTVDKDVRQSLEGEKRGTPAYMAPEQARGELNLDQRSDVYGLGAMLYEILTGQPPFQHDIELLRRALKKCGQEKTVFCCEDVLRDLLNRACEDRTRELLLSALQKVQQDKATASTEEELKSILQSLFEQEPTETLRKVCHKNPIRPRDINRATPRALEAICLKAMAKRRENRYDTAQQLAADIELWLADEPVRAFREPFLPRLGRWQRRHRTFVVSCFVLLATLLVAGGVGTIVYLQVTKAATEATLRQLLNAKPQAVPEILANLDLSQEQLLRRLRKTVGQSIPEDETAASRALLRQHRTRAALALLPVNPQQTEWLQGRLLAEEVEPEEMLLIRNQLLAHRRSLAKDLWAKVDQPGTSTARRFRALVSLAGFDPQNPRWEDEADRVVEPLLSNKYVETWARALKPVGAALIKPLSNVVRDRRTGKAYAERRRLAARIVAGYASNELETLVGLVIDGDQGVFFELLPTLKAHKKRAAEHLKLYLNRKPKRRWDDWPSGVNWQKPGLVIRKKIEKAQGILTENFSLVQMLPEADLTDLTGKLKQHGYRPIRCRHFLHEGNLRVAVVWKRDGKQFKLQLDLTANKARELQDQTYPANGWMPVDLAGYVTRKGERFAVVWVRATDKDFNRRLIIENVSAQRNTKRKKLGTDGYGPVIYQKILGTDSKIWNAEIWQQPVPPYWKTRYTIKALYEAFLAKHVALCQFDIGLFPMHLGLGLIYVGVWHGSDRFESQESHGLSPKEHLIRCRELTSDGFRPVSLALAQRKMGAQLVTASVWRRPIIKAKQRETLAHRRANAALALFRLGVTQGFWDLLKHDPFPDVRNHLITRLATYGVKAESMVDQILNEKNSSVRQALLLALGDYTETQLSKVERQRLVRTLLEWYEDDPNPAVHSAIGWLLRHKMEGPEPRQLDWGQAAALKQIDRKLALETLLQRYQVPMGGLIGLGPRNPLAALPWLWWRPPKNERRAMRRWYVNCQGQTMVILTPSQKFKMGSPYHELGRLPRDPPVQWKRIQRTFAIAAKEVTVTQFRQFRQGYPQYSLRGERFVDDAPVINVNWYEAAKYCRWLSEQEGVSEDQMCYPPMEKIKPGMKLHADYLSRTGYRLPTLAEWEFACRAYTRSAHSFGSTGILADRYSWFVDNSRPKDGNHSAWPVGQKRPNDFGLFDMHGNVWEWCQDEKLFCAQRGATFYAIARDLRSANQIAPTHPHTNSPFLGFRVARTYR